MSNVESKLPEMSRFKRFMVGDVVSFEDSSEFPPVHMEGHIVGFDNPERTYLKIDFGDDGEKVLTEDEVQRIA